ncbi:MAG: flagellar assembly protein FliW [Candidatus Rokubacteria bacterium]|nr:flagellar assembly protein FliW [Candidatus Rokubacteria bacterium]
MSRPRTLKSPKLGPITFTPGDVIRFPEGLPGFESFTKFLLVTRSECAPFVFLTALDQPEIALPLLPPLLVQPGWTPPVEPPADAARDDLAWYVVVIIAPRAEALVANLRAPIRINLRDRIGCQVVLDDERVPLTAPLGAGRP